MEFKELSPTLTLIGRAEEIIPNREGIPLYLSNAVCGFPSPADDYIEGKIDLQHYLIKNSISTFFIRASGDSMAGAGIHDGDLLIVDRSVEAVNGKVVIASLDDELMVKTLVRTKNRVLLCPANDNFPEFDITNREYVYIWGVVTYVIHKL